MTRAAFRATVAALALAALLGACGGGGGKTAAQPTPSATTCTPSDSPTVAVLDSRFDPKDLCVKAGATVTWTFKGILPHTVTADDTSFDSKSQNKGFTFTRTFSVAGKVPYYCTLHGAKGGGAMAGTVTVVA